MSTLKLRVTLSPATIEVQSEDFQEAWEDDREEGEDVSEPSTEFILERVLEEFESGDRDILEAFEGAAIEVEIAQ